MAGRQGAMGTVDVQGVVHEANGDFRVHTRAYVDEEIFRLEMERIFGRTWIYLAHESEIPTPGDYKTGYIGLEPVIVSRDENGDIHVMFNRCPHRGSVVCRQETGSAHYFRCPYHGWVFDNRGRLRGIAQRKDAYPDHFQPPEGLQPVARVETYRGLIFANMSPEGPSLLEHLGPARKYIDLQFDRSPVGEVELRYGAHRVEYRGNWKFQSENVVDGYHGDYVHDSFFKVVEKFGTASGQHNNYIHKTAREIKRYRKLTSYTDGFPGGHGLLVYPAEPNAIENLRSKYPDYVADLEARWGSEALQDILTVYNLLVWPNLGILQGQIRLIRPISVDRTEVLYYQTALRGAPEAYNTARLRGYERFFGPAGFGAPDDVEVFALNQSGLQAKSVDWLVLARGLQREELPERRFDGSDEIPQRSFYRQWKEAMNSRG